MAVEVLRPGQPPAEKKMHGICLLCKCEIRCLMGDAKCHRADRSDDPRETDWYGVRCPTAGCDSTISVVPVKEQK